MNIFITGGTTGIGMALAKIYLSKGYRVGVCGRSDKHFKESFADLDEESVSNLSFYLVDVCDQKTLNEAIIDFSAEKGLDLLIANAGISMGVKSLTPNFDRARSIIQTNVIGVINTFETGFMIMSEQFKKENRRGQLVAMASVAGLVGLPRTGPYSASKSAILRLCESYQLDFENFGVDVTAIAPGFIDTPLTRQNKHRMPFLVPLEVAARKISEAIKKKKGLYFLPWPMKISMIFLAYLPQWAYKLVMKGPLKSLIK